VRRIAANIAKQPLELRCRNFERRPSRRLALMLEGVARELR